MTTVTKLLATAAICALPLVAGAQTSTPMDKSPTGGTLPADQPRTDLEQKATTDNGQGLKYGQPQSDPSPSTTGSAMGKSKMNSKHMNKMNKSDQAAPGDSPTYPAKTNDGRPTSDSNMSK